MLQGQSNLNAVTTFVIAGNKILLPITYVLLCSVSENFTTSEKQRDWALLNAVLLPPFLTETAILDGETNAEDILKIFVHGITDRAEEEEEDNRDNDDKESA